MQKHHIRIICPSFTFQFGQFAHWCLSVTCANFSQTVSMLSVTGNQWHRETPRRSVTCIDKVNMAQRHKELSYKFEKNSQVPKKLRRSEFIWTTVHQIDLILLTFLLLKFISKDISDRTKHQTAILDSKILYFSIPHAHAGCRTQKKCWNHGISSYYSLY